MFPLVTLTSDFGTGSSYAAALKGVILSRCPEARVFDLSHELPPQDLTAAALFLSDAVPWFPPKTIHVVVIDAGVGTERDILCVEWKEQRLLVPDNGLWTPLCEEIPPTHVIRLTDRSAWHDKVSATFHGRDIFAPVAAALCQGIAPAQLGEPKFDWQKWVVPHPIFQNGAAIGRVLIVDRFGNLITNLRWEDLEGLGLPSGRISIAGMHPHVVRTYGEVPAGTLVALCCSSGRLEIAVVNGSAARRLGVGVGAEVRVEPAIASDAANATTS